LGRVVSKKTPCRIFPPQELLGFDFKIIEKQ
jgi:hypothetical protein